MRSDPRGVRAGGIVLAGLVSLALIVPYVAATDPLRTDLAARLRPPSTAHLLGQDALGRDVLARLLAGARLSFAVGAAAVALSLAVGVALGAFAGWRGGWVDEGIARLIDVLLAFPGLLLAIALAAILGPSVGNVILALAVLGWTGYARLTRAQIRSLRQRPLTEAALALGASPLRVVCRHLLPLAAPALLVQATFGLSGAIIAEASLSFLGVGAPPPTPSWGAMLDEGRQFMLVDPHLVLVPGTALVATVLALQLVGDGLQDRLAIRTARDQRGD
jgi:peptide/nickel transport system permease protein